jgi:hypothetical protein
MLSPQREIVAALLEEERSRPSPENLRISADFELPGAASPRQRLGARNVSIGCSRRFWAAVRDELARLVAERDAGRLDGLVVWTCNDPKVLGTLAEMRVDGVITDDTALLRRIVSERSRSR